MDKKHSCLQLAVRVYATRLHEFPNESHCVLAGKAGPEVSKHLSGKERLQRNEAQEQDITQQFATYNKQEHLHGETLPSAVQVYCIKVVKTFLCTGVHVNKVDLLPELFEEGGIGLAGFRSPSDLVPFIRKQEVDRTNTGGNI